METKLKLNLENVKNLNLNGCCWHSAGWLTISSWPLNQNPNPHPHPYPKPNPLGLARQKMKHFRSTLALAEQWTSTKCPSGIHQISGAVSSEQGLSQICQPGETVNNRRKFEQKQPQKTALQATRSSCISIDEQTTNNFALGKTNGRQPKEQTQHAFN